MALTRRLDGTQQSNLVTSAWWNDYYDLLSGAMTDQIVTLKTDVVVAAIGAAPAAPTLALAAGTALGIGAYQYVTTFVDASSGETLAGTAASVTTTSGNQAVNLSAIATGPAGTTKRNIYRTKVGGSVYYLLHTLADNTTTTYSDTTADTALGTSSPPLNPSFGGLIVQDASGASQARLFTNGAAWFGGEVMLGQYESGGSMTGYNYANIQWNHGAGAIYYQPALSFNGASGHLFETGNGSTFYAPFSIGGQISGSLAWIDNTGKLFAPGISLSGTLTASGLTQDANKVLSFSVYDGAAATQKVIRIFIGTVDPSTYTTMNDGDLWVKA